MYSPLAKPHHSAIFHCETNHHPSVSIKTHGSQISQRHPSVVLTSPVHHHHSPFHGGVFFLRKKKDTIWIKDHSLHSFTPTWKYFCLPNAHAPKNPSNILKSVNSIDSFPNCILASSWSFYRVPYIFILVITITQKRRRTAGWKRSIPKSILNRRRSFCIGNRKLIKSNYLPVQKWTLRRRSSWT